MVFLSFMLITGHKLSVWLRDVDSSDKVSPQFSGLEQKGDVYIELIKTITVHIYEPLTTGVACLSRAIRTHWTEQNVTKMMDWIKEN